MNSNTLNFLTLDSRVYGLPFKKDIDRTARAVKKSAHQITFDILYHEAEKLARMVKEEINTQPATWPPLNEAYKDWKGRTGLNTDMLKATEAYFDSISVYEVRNDMGQFSSSTSIEKSSTFTIRVGVPLTRHPGLGGPEDEGKKNPRYTELAHWLEFGTDKMPARPHWAPAYSRWRSRHVRTVKARITSLLLRKFRQDFRRHLIKPSQAKKVK